MMFTTKAALTAFQRTVLYEISLNDIFLSLARILAQRMAHLVGGRLWMGAHMRRGDCESHVLRLPRLAMLMLRRSRFPRLGRVKVR
jgi:hypothetical protein